MACMYLLGNPDHYTSHRFVPFYWKQYANRVAAAWYAHDKEVNNITPENTEVEQFDERLLLSVASDGNVVSRSKVDDYIHRPQELEDMSLYDWVTYCEKVAIPSKHRLNNGTR